MKKASNIRLSLRKLLVATLAVGPLAVLPAPLWAAVPSAAPYTVTSGSAVWSATPNVSGTVNASDRAILVWSAGAFNIAVGETFTFQLPTGGAVLNKVGYTTTGGLATLPDNATIDGTLFSSGRVFVLANGAISVGGAASITTGGGLFLSTIQETSDFGFLTTGALQGTGVASSGTGVTIGSASASPTISGNLDVSAGAIVSNRAAVSGDVVYRAITATSGIDLSANGTFAAGGNLSVTTNGGVITGTNAVTAGLVPTGNQTATFSTGVTSGNGVNVTLNHASNDFEIVSVNAAGATADVTLKEANIVTLGASTIGRDLIVEATGTAGTTGVQNNGTVAIGRNASFTVTTGNSGVSISNNSTIGGSLAASLSNSSFTFNGTGSITIGSAATITSTINGINANTGNRTGVSVTAGNGTLTVTQPVIATGNGTSGAGITLTAGSIATTGTGTIAQTSATGSTVTLNATTGSISVGANITGDKLTLRTAGGSISQTTTGNLATANTGNQTSPVANVFNAGIGSVTLNVGTNTLASGSTVQLTGSSATVSNANTMLLGTSNVTGAVALTTTTAAQGVQLGAGLGTAGQVINIGGILSVTTNNGAITDENSGAQSIFGGLNLATTGGAVTLDAARVNGPLSPLVQFGAIAINSGSGVIDVAESGTVNLGAITTTGGLTARSVTGGIVDTGTLAVTGAGSTFVVTNSAESVVIDNTGHTLTSVNVQGGTNHSVLVGAATSLTGSLFSGSMNLSSAPGVALTLAANNIAGNLVVNSGGTIAVSGALNIAGDLSLTAADTSATSITQSAGISVTNVTTLASSGNIVLANVGNNFNSVVFNGVTGNAQVFDQNNITASGNATALVDVRAGSNNGIGGAFGVVLGNLIVGSLNVQSQDGTGGSGGGVSGTITQAAGSKIHSEGAASFGTESANIVINNTGNNFGRVGAVTGNGAGITLRENGTLRLGVFTNNGVNSTITSETGSIIEDSTIGATATNLGVTNSTVSLNAPNGSIQLGGLTNVTGGPVTTGGSTRITANAPNGSVQLFSSTTNLVLDSITANSFSVVNTGGGNLTQAGSGIKSFGPASFTSGANITLTNPANNFGRVSITSTSGSKNITIIENATLNLGTVSVPGAATGNFTATSTTGDIIDTGLGGVKLGGVAGLSPSPGTGIVTLIAPLGNITLDDPTTEFATNGGVVFNGGNVTLSGLGQTTIWLGAATGPSTAGNLTVTSSIGSIGNTGNLTVTGTAFVQAPAGNISLGQPANQFGSLRFVGNQVSIAQTNNMNIQTGSAALGQAQLASTGGNIGIVNVGGGPVSFGSTVTLTASGTITIPKLLQAVGFLTVNAAGTKDLSALSISTDLSNKTPNNLGTGAYVPPGQ